MRSEKLALVLFIAFTVGMGIILGFSFTPGEWYAGLNKPTFNPPNWIFGPVWTILYILIGIVGWRVWHRSGDGSLRVLWVIQMALNFIWTPIFFGAQKPGLALVVIIALLAAIICFILRAKESDRMSAWMFLPYLAWVSFATYLTASVTILNP